MRSAEVPVRPLREERARAERGGGTVDEREEDPEEQVDANSSCHGLPIDRALIENPEPDHDHTCRNEENVQHRIDTSHRRPAHDELEDRHDDRKDGEGDGSSVQPSPDVQSASTSVALSIRISAPRTQLSSGAATMKTYVSPIRSRTTPYVWLARSLSTREPGLQPRSAIRAQVNLGARTDPDHAVRRPRCRPRSDDDPRSERGPSVLPTTPPAGTGDEPTGRA